MHRMLSHRGCHRAVDFVAQWISLHSGLSYIGCCHVEDVIVQWISSCSVFRRAVDFIAQWVVAQWISSRRIFLHTGYKSHYGNEWFSGQIQDHFMTNWRVILKLRKRVLFRKNQIIKMFHILGYSKEYLSPIFQFS
jgi:hypothetical protein